MVLLPPRCQCEQCKAHDEHLHESGAERGERVAREIMQKIWPAESERKSE